MPSYEPLFQIRRSWRGLVGSHHPPTRLIDRHPPIRSGHYAQKVPSAPTGYRNGRKRRTTRFPLPQYAGRSRSYRLRTAQDGDPVRKRHSTASRKRRLSAVRPGSVACPDRSGSIRSPIASVKTVRSLFMIRLSQECTSPLFRATLGVNGTDIQERSRVDVNGP